MKIILPSFLLRLREADQSSQLPQLVLSINQLLSQGKMKLYLCIIVILNCVCGYTMIEIIPELKTNVLKFGCGTNYNYEGMLSHSFDRFYVVTKFELPKVEDLKLTTISYDSTCQYLEKANSMQSYPTQYIRDMKKYCLMIALYVCYYRKQIDYYNWRLMKL